MYLLGYLTRGLEMMKWKFDEMEIYIYIFFFDIQMLRLWEEAGMEYLKKGAGIS